MHIETKCLHEGYKPGNGEPKALPIYQSTTYTYDSTEHIGQLFESLDYLLARALEKPADDGGAQRRADRLGARCDMLRIALDDEQKRFGRLKSEAGGMVTFLKEYVALPETARQSGLQAFCEQAAQRLSRVECALMDEP